ncbi:Protein F55F10.1 b [Aphelenchoides avenae]|nr:Protein F55F10.1 b [Aphelenchus avenae]
MLKYAELFDKKAIRMNQLPSTAVPAVAAFVNVIPTLLAIGSLPNTKHQLGLPLVHNLIVFHFFSAQTPSEKLGIALLAHIYRTMVESGMLSGLVGAKLSGIVKKLDDHFTTQPGVYNELPCGKLNFCRPLTDVDEATTIEQLTLHEAETTPLANNSVSVASEALGFLQALVDVADALCTRSFEHCRSLSALPWTDTNAKRFCLTIDYLNSFVLGINNKPAAIPTQPFVLNSVLKLWSQIAFRVDMWHVPLKELSETAKSLRSYHNLLWNVSFMQSGLRRQFETIRKEIRSFMSLAELQIPGRNDDADDEDAFWLAALGSSIKLLEALTLPRQMIDPAIENEVKLTYLQKKLDLVESQLEAVGRFLQLVVGDYKMSRFGKQDTHCYESVTIAYRPKYAKYEKLVDALNNFTSQVTACASENCIVTRSDARSLLQNNEADLRRIHSQLASIGKSAAAFKSQLIRGYYEYPDLIAPYITGLNVFRTAASHFAQRIEFLLQQRRLHPELRSIAQNGIRNAMHDPALTAWMLSSESPLPLKLQLALVERQIAQGEIPRAIVWLEEKWNVWHEQHSEKREKMFVYKRTGQSTADDEEMTDPEEEELRALLPNYSEVSLDDLSAEPTGPLVDELDTEDLHRLLMSLADAEKKTSPPFPHTSYLRLLSDLADTGLVTAKDDEHLSYYHAVESKRLLDAVGNRASSAAHSSTRTLNVYAENDTAEVLRCVAAINDLRRRVRQLLEEYPENVVLADINAAVDKFLEASSSSPQMRLASLLEKVLELSEEWQKIADRAHSIRDELLVLQEILLSWRKMEVLCWSNILERVEADSVQLTVLTSWPLVASLKDAIASLDQWTPDTEAKLLAALVDWIHSSTFLDFHARLRSGQLLARFAEIWSVDGFAGKVRCVLRHYEQFSPLIVDKLRRYRGEVDQKLKNFVDVAKYTDLNLWSVKHSAEKAHRQLLSIVKSFKVVLAIK